MKIKNLLLAILCCVTIWGCNKPGKSNIVTFSGAIYSAKDSLPFKNTVFDIYTERQEFGRTAYIDKQQSFTTDSMGNFTVDFDCQSQQDIMLKWPYGKNSDDAIYSWNLRGYSEPANTKGIIIYIE